ncbi:TasA family protein [Clavibacter sp. MX14-G9D]|uniref:TasA family protein n=1 Tax=Clavibacter sp. MX14-G9D TaxID=3064656 RepID=UPI00293EBE7E|nr:TasA family protein [Clavibacter sp. MX14-G9D]
MPRNEARAPRPARGRRSARPVRRSPLRAAWLTTGLLSAVVVASLTATGGSYALWNGTASTQPASVSSGTSGLVITQQSALDVSRLLPGQGALGTFTARNTGTVALDVAVSARGTSSNTAFPGELSVRLGPVASPAACVSGATTWSGRPGQLTTTGSFTRIQPGASAVVCTEVVLDQDAPQSVQGATAQLTFAVIGTQVQP